MPKPRVPKEQVTDAERRALAAVVEQSDKAGQAVLLAHNTLARAKIAQSLAQQDLTEHMQRVKARYKLGPRDGIDYTTGAIVLNAAPLNGEESAMTGHA